MAKNIYEGEKAASPSSSLTSGWRYELVNIVIYGTMESVAICINHFFFFAPLYTECRININGNVHVFWAHVGR